MNVLITGGAGNFASITSSGLRDNASPYSAVTGFICEWER